MTTTMTADFLPPLAPDWEATRATLHRYAQAVGVVPRAHAAAHPKWWHISLQVRPTGLVTVPMVRPGGGSFHLRMNLRDHAVHLETSLGDHRVFSMTEGRPGTDFGDRILAAVAELGLDGPYARERFESDEPAVYDPSAAETFWSALVNVASVLEEHRLSLDGTVGQVQLWPHGFDVSTEWFGTRTVEAEEHGEVQSFPSQLNLGFYPGTDEPYFYSNPWPFDERLVGEELPHGARWHTDGWEGTYLPYANLAGDPHAAAKLREFAARVHELAAPTLTAD